MKCDSCGAAIAPAALTCEYCNSPVQSEAEGKPNRAPLFAKVRDWEKSSLEQFDEMLSHLPNGGLTGEFGAIIIGVFFAVFGFGAAHEMSSDRHAPAFMMLCFGGFGCLGLVFILGAVVQLLRELSADPIARPAVVIAKRSETSGGGEDHSITTTHFVTFEFESGQREALEVDGKTYGEVAEEDAGMLITRLDQFAKFVRVV